MPKTSLTDMQRVILSGAAMRPDYRVLPVPKSIQKNATAIALSIKPMLGKGLVLEVPAVCGGDKTIHWNASVLLGVAE